MKEKLVCGTSLEQDTLDSTLGFTLEGYIPEPTLDFTLEATMEATLEATMEATLEPIRAPTDYHSVQDTLRFDTHWDRILEFRSTIVKVATVLLEIRPLPEQETNKDVLLVHRESL